MKVRLTQIDGHLPNLALMKLAHWHKQQGHQVTLTRELYRNLFETEQYDLVYGSSIFKYSADRIARFQAQWPGAMLGGTGTGSLQVVEELTGYEHQGYDYSVYPDFRASIGFTQRGCRLNCKWCVVPWKEGKNRSAVTSINEIYRGEPAPHSLHLLDNDFFGQPRDQWQARIEEIRAGRFKVCLSQGINIRLIDSEAAIALASIEYRNKDFNERKLYTAWDNIGDEAIFFRGVEALSAAGIPPHHLRVYMLIGFDPRETWERIWYRFKRMHDMKIEPFAMAYDRSRADLRCFARWVNTGLYRHIDWPDYVRETKTDEMMEGWKKVYARE